MIANTTRNTLIASQLKITQNPWQRMKGLIGVDHFPQGQALVITHCQSIHMFFMKIPIDVIFCDQRHKVVGLCKEIRPFRLSPIFFSSVYSIEIPAGTIALSQTQIGDQLEVEGL